MMVIMFGLEVDDTFLGQSRDLRCVALDSRFGGKSLSCGTHRSPEREV